VIALGPRAVHDFSLQAASHLFQSVANFEIDFVAHLCAKIANQNIVIVLPESAKQVAISVRKSHPSTSSKVQFPSIWKLSPRQPFCACWKTRLLKSIVNPLHLMRVTGILDHAPTHQLLLNSGWILK
jgi:hypothetical protein